MNSPLNSTITQYFLQARRRDKSFEAMRFYRHRSWVSLSWNEFFNQSESIGCALSALGIQRGDPVGIMSDTRPEWAFADLGIMGIGGITVPIYQSNSAEDIEYIINDSGCKVLIVEDHSNIKKWSQISENCPSVEKLVCIHSYPDLPDEILSWEEFIDLGEDYQQAHPEHYAEQIRESRVAEVATIIYTSGTTGAPKGVVLTHKQFVSEVKDAFQVLGITQNDRTLTFLPLAHIFGRIEVLGSIYQGYTLGFAQSIERIPANLKQVQPTVLIAVPRIFEKIYNAILTQVEANPLKKRLFQWAVELGKKVSACKQQKKPIPPQILAQYLVAQKLVFSKVNERLGGNLRFAISGGAPLSKDIAEFFHAAGLLILEGYGLTETTAAITANTPFAYRFGTVGKAIGDVDLKIAEDGEILVKSDKIMRGYYKKPETTQEVFTENGYFKTGDIGELSPEGFLTITDRKKDLIKTAGGKYVAPQKLESLVKLHPLVSQVLVYGDRKKYIVALLTLNRESVEDYAKTNQLSFQNYEALVKHPEIQKQVREAVANANFHLASFETIKNFDVLTADFTLEAGELTPSLKVKRKHCTEKYYKELEALY